jgi:hypothetical protein
LGCLAGGINKSGSFRAVAISSRDPHSLNPIPLGEKRSYLDRCRAHVVSWNASWPRTRHFESLRADHPINWTFGPVPLETRSAFASIMTRYQLSAREGSVAHAFRNYLDRYLTGQILSARSPQLSLQLN